MKIDVASLSDIKTQKPFNSLFTIDPVVLQAVQDDMKHSGYDEAFPIILWNKIVIDGHTRLQAAINLDLKEVPVFEYEFNNENDALEYAIHNQRNRRNISEADLSRVIDAVDKRKTKQQAGKSGGITQQANLNSSLLPESSAKKTADIVGCTKTKVEETRFVSDHADKKTKQQLDDGDKTIHQAYTDTKKKIKAKKADKFGEIFTKFDTDQKNKHFNNIMTYFFELKNDRASIIKEMIEKKIEDKGDNFSKFVQNYSDTKHAAEKEKPDTKDQTIDFIIIPCDKLPKQGEHQPDWLKKLLYDALRAGTKIYFRPGLDIYDIGDLDWDKPENKKDLNPDIIDAEDVTGYCKDRENCEDKSESNVKQITNNQCI